MNMEILNVYSIAGLYYELYVPKKGGLSVDDIDLLKNDSLIHLNELFWAEQFSLGNLQTLMLKLKQTNSNSKGLSIQEKAIMANPSLFIEKIKEACSNIAMQPISIYAFFEYVETLSIACEMLSKYIYAPFKLTIQDGFEIPNYSASYLIDYALDRSRNPYLDFLEKHVFANVTKKYDLIWINGQLDISTIAIAKYIKSYNPQSVVGVRYHSSEYFSLNKIVPYLKNNFKLFELVDFIVLDDNPQTCGLIEEQIKKLSLNYFDIPNIIFIDRNSNSICTSPVKKLSRTFESDVEHNYTKGREIINLRLNPNMQCFWKRCSFCGINEKYKYITECETESIEDKCDRIQSLEDKGIKYIWFEDEAVPPKIIIEFAELLIRKNIKLKWQIRSRLDKVFDKNICQLLYQAGLREIRFGLESGSARILSSMDKLDESVSLNDIESIVSNFNAANIHIHFPMIVGYPTETRAERKSTYAYLLMLKRKYVRFSFNVNILMLDVTSKLFKNFSHYDICAIKFPCSPHDFVGNFVDYFSYDADDPRQIIDNERIQFMGKVLYPWMPKTAMTKAHIFYRLSETIRNTLFWAESIEAKEAPGEVNQHTEYILSPDIVWWEEDNKCFVYNWASHYLFECKMNGLLFSQPTELDKTSPAFREAINAKIFVKK